MTSFLHPLSDHFDRIEVLIEIDSRAIQTLRDSMVDAWDKPDEITTSNQPHYKTN